jgi:hypothetical protein
MICNPLLRLGRQVGIWSAYADQIIVRKDNDLHALVGKSASSPFFREKRKEREERESRGVFADLPTNTPRLLFL